MSRIIKRAFLLLIILVMCAFSMSCRKKDGTGYIFRYALTQDPKNLDPQLAVDQQSLTVIQNMFEGLLKKTSAGTLTEGIASNFTVSDDGLKYTFTLRENSFWKGKDNFSQNVTADDFVFTFRRLVDAKTYSPYAEEFLCIKNAAKINKGQLTTDALGVKATGKYQLEIELDYPNAEFLNLLTTPAAAPCNEDFFNKSNGRYGLESDYIICNGPFYLTQWLFDPYGKDNYLILKKNAEYYDAAAVSPAGLNYFIVRNRDKIITDYKNDATDLITDNGLNKSLFSSGNISQEYEAVSSGLYFNTKKPILANAEVRKALCAAIDRNALTDNKETSIRAAYGIVPSGVTMLNKSFRELASEPATSQYNFSLAQYLWVSTLTKADKESLNGMTIIASEDYPYSKNLKKIADQWRNVLGLNCSVEIIPQSDYESRIKSGDYYIAFAEIKGDSDNPSAFLNYFKTGDNNNIFAFSSTSYDAMLKSAKSTKSLSDSVDKYGAAEKYLIDSNFFAPIYYQKEYLIFKKDISEVTYNPFTKQIDFSRAKNKK